MASIVLTAVGNAALPGIGGLVLGTLGRFAGGAIDQQLGLAGSRKLIGPRLENLKVQDSRYGAGIPMLYGRARVAGQVIWASDLQETTHEEQAAGGGKGGGGGFSSTRYSYSLHCAIAIGRGPLARLAAVWADGKQIYDGLNWKDGVVTSAVFYQGGAAQLPDPVMQAALGLEQVPAYRGMAYVVLENFQLADFGNRLPNLTFEVLATTAAAAPQLGANTPPMLQNAGNGYATLGGTPPLVVSGNARQTTQVLVAGMQNVTAASTTAAFVVCRYAVNGEQPQEVRRDVSAVFSINNALAGMSWALSPDGRYVVIVAGSQSAPLQQMTCVLYEVQSQQFGAPLQLTTKNFVKSIAWLDATRCVLADHDGNALGVQVLARSGRNLTALGFFGIWGAGSASNRATIGTAQFLPLAGGLLMLTGNSGMSPSTLYGCHMVWDGQKVAHGAPYSLATSVPANALNYADVIACGSGEYCFIVSS
jgi:hypothetical protein